MGHTEVSLSPGYLYMKMKNRGREIRPKGTRRKAHFPRTSPVIEHLLPVNGDNHSSKGLEIIYPLVY